MRPYLFSARAAAKTTGGFFWSFSDKSGAAWKGSPLAGGFGGFAELSYFGFWDVLENPKVAAQGSECRGEF